MNDRSYSATIEVGKSPNEVFNHIIDVPKWWGGNDLLGSTTKLNDEFAIDHPGAHYSKQKLIEVIPNEKIVWLVTESQLDWIKKNKTEWTNTKMVFEITGNSDKSVLLFTHEGLVPELECYTRVSKDWDIVIKEWLFDFITQGKAHF